MPLSGVPGAGLSPQGEEISLDYPECIGRRFLFSGEIFAPSRPYLVTTVLGSCVSVCLWDPVRGLGGINHFVAPYWDGKSAPSNRYGDIAIDALVNKMLTGGSRRSHLRAKVIGGGGVLRLAEDPGRLGKDNVEAAMDALSTCRIRVAASDTGLAFGRKLLFSTLDGSAFVKKIKSFRGPSRQ